MLGTLVAAAALCAASVVVGEAVARALGLEPWRGSSPAVGLAVLLVISTTALELPGHAATAALVIGFVTLVAVVAAVQGRRPSLEWHVVAVTLIVALAACIPYVSNGRFGVLGVSFNNDLSFHLRWAEVLKDPDLPGVLPPRAGYPLGAHSLTAVVSKAVGVDVAQAMAALLLSSLVLLGWAALPLLRGLSRPRMALAAVLVALAYTVSSFYGQANFKELLLTLFLVAGVGIARAAAGVGADRASWRVGIQLGLLGAAIVFAVSYAGLAWPGLTAAVWATAAVFAAIASSSGNLPARLRVGLSRLRPAAVAGHVALATSAVLVATDVSRVVDSWQLLGLSPTSVGTLGGVETGNVPAPVSEREVLGFWPSEDFRLDAELSAVGEVVSSLTLVLACAGAVWWLRRSDVAVPAAAGASVALLVYLGWSESAYIASKALPPAGAFVMLLMVRPLLTPWRVGLPRRLSGVAQVAAVAVVACGALWSSCLVLRGAQVGPRAHAAELAELRPRVEGERVLFLGNDEFVRFELHGAGVLLPPTAGRTGKEWQYGDARDFDSSPPSVLDRIDAAIVPSGSYRSEPPANFELVASTDSYELWRRAGTTPARRILSEHAQPGAVLDCSEQDGRALARRTGWARVWAVSPRVVPLPQRARALRAGETTRIALELDPGRWELSLAYTSPQEVDLEVRDRGWTRTLPANLDRPGPFWPVGELRLEERGVLSLRFEIAADPLGARTHVAQLLTLAAVRADLPHELVPLSAACGRYVDWYTLGPERPSVP